MSNDGTIRDLVSIIIPCWNQIEFTQQCIAALKSHTGPAWELIVVDNGSTDGTGTYLAGVRDMSTVPVTVVSNATNVGFPAAINQGLRLARGEYLVMLNNDVVVTDGWLDQLIALVNARSGAAGAATGTLGNAEADGEGRPSVDSGAGSRDPRTAPLASGVGDGSGAVAATPPASEACVDKAAWPTPPGPPFTRGGKVIVPPGGDLAGTGVETGAPPSAGIVPGSAESVAGTAEVPVDEAAWPTPPGPPFTRGGKVIVPPGVDLAGAGVETGARLLLALCLVLRSPAASRRRASHGCGMGLETSTH